jgi:hypothetical protein
MTSKPECPQLVGQLSKNFYTTGGEAIPGAKDMSQDIRI